LDAGKGLVPSKPPDTLVDESTLQTS